MTSNHLGEGRFAGPIWAHDGMHLPGRDLKAKALENRITIDGSVEICDAKAHREKGLLGKEQAQDLAGRSPLIVSSSSLTSVPSGSSRRSVIWHPSLNAMS